MAHESLTFPDGSTYTPDPDRVQAGTPITRIDGTTYMPDADAAPAVVHRFDGTTLTPDPERTKPQEASNP